MDGLALILIGSHFAWRAFLVLPASPSLFPFISPQHPGFKGRSPRWCRAARCILPEQSNSPSEAFLYGLFPFPPPLLPSPFQDPDNPAVQLQGPFTIDRIVPPPVHRNVIMIAAGTGINPSEEESI